MKIATGKIYQYKGVTFDWHNWLGPIILNRKTLNERPWSSVKRRQWALLAKWQRLSKEQQELYRI
jgi:hypothetical protein